MTHSTSRLGIYVLNAALAAVMVVLCGCSSEKYKAQADEEAYKIVDEKWIDEHGQKVNYHISDVNASPNDVAADINLPTSGVLTLGESVAIAVARNRDYQRRKEDLFLTALDLTLVRHDFARSWFGTVDAFYERQGKQSGLTDEREKVSAGSQIGFSQLLADGTQISMSIALDWARFLGGDPQSSLQSVLVATIKKPLLRGASRKIVQEKLTQAEREVLYEIRSFNRFRKTFVVSIVDEYYRVLQRLDEVENAESNYKMREVSKERLELEGQVGRRNRFEVDQAVQDWLKSRDNLVSTKQRYQQAIDEFKITLALPVEVNMVLDPNALDQLQRAGVSDIAYSLELAVDTALLNRLDLASSVDRVEDAIRKVVVAEDDLGAELNLIGSANVSSAERTRAGRYQFNIGDYGAGLEADLPFDRKAERNAYRESLISLSRQQRQYDLDRDSVILDVRQAYRVLIERAERYNIQKKSLELARRRVDSTTMLMKEGRGTTRDLLESQDALLDAQNSVTAALIDHTIAKLNFFTNIGVLQVRPDGMWQEE